MKSFLADEAPKKPVAVVHKRTVALDDRALAEALAAGVPGEDIVAGLEAFDEDEEEVDNEDKEEEDQDDQDDILAGLEGAEFDDEDAQDGDDDATLQSDTEQAELNSMIKGVLEEGEA